MMEGEGEGPDFLDDSLPRNLTVDDEQMDEDEALEDIEEDIERIRNRTTPRTLFRQPRGDNDTV